MQPMVCLHQTQPALETPSNMQTDQTQVAEPQVNAQSQQQLRELPSDQRDAVQLLFVLHLRTSLGPSEKSLECHRAFLD
jgi:hypothetical protein